MFTVLATDSNTKASELDLDEFEYRQRVLIEMPTLGDMLLDLKLTNPVVGLDSEHLTCIGFEKIAYHLQ